MADSYKFGDKYGSFPAVVSVSDTLIYVLEIIEVFNIYGYMTNGCDTYSLHVHIHTSAGALSHHQSLYSWDIRGGMHGECVSVRSMCAHTVLGTAVNVQLSK